jgi:general secretion pathway protein G
MNRRRTAFTLIEVLLVLVIIGLLAGIVAPQFFGIQRDAEKKAAAGQIDMFRTALQHYRLTNGAYPTTEQGLDALINQPTSEPIPKSWSGPYLDTKTLLDPWGSQYGYRYPGEHNPNEPDIWSTGPDRQPGNEDDVTSWTTQ